MAISAKRALLLGFPAFGAVMALPILANPGFAFPPSAGIVMPFGLPFAVVAVTAIMLFWTLIGVVAAGVFALLTRKKDEA